MTSEAFSELLCEAFQPDESGVIGVADRLLAIARERPISLSWDSGECRACELSAIGDGVALPLRKSVFRALLARVAALSGESPYGGEGTVSIVSNPPSVILVSYVNTPQEQRVRLEGLTGPKQAAPAGFYGRAEERELHEVSR